MSCCVYLGPHSACTRLGNVEGHRNKKNEMIFHAPISAAKPVGNVVFFPGDVQNYQEVMLAHPESSRYIRWNLESTAELLSRRFPDHHVWIVKPASMQLQTFSVFSHFVHSNPIGVPTFGDGQESWHHLKVLMESAVTQIRGMDQCKKKVQSLKDDSKEEPMQSKGPMTDTKESCVSNVSDDESAVPIRPSVGIPLTLIGFSKGCVVLNQLLHDITDAQNDPDVSWFLDCVDNVYWLDGAHNGGSNTWVVHGRILDKLLHVGWQFHVHVTPYQVRDSSRKWIRAEHEEFLKKLRARNLNVESKLHFCDEERSLENHFRLLEDF